MIQSGYAASGLKARRLYFLPRILEFQIVILLISSFSHGILHVCTIHFRTPEVMSMPKPKFACDSIDSFQYSFKQDRRQM